MSLHDIKSINIDSRIQTLSLTNDGAALTPATGRGFINVPLPHDKLNINTISAIKLTRISIGDLMLNNGRLWDDFLSNNWWVQPSGGTEILFGYPPLENPPFVGQRWVGSANWWNSVYGWALLPVNITSMATMAVAIQNYMNSRITTLGLDAENGGANAYQVSWVAGSTVQYSAGFFVFTNIYNVSFKLRFKIFDQDNITGRPAGLFLGFGSTITEYDTTHISRSSVLDIENLVGERVPVLSYLLVITELISGGVDSGVLLLNGALNDFGILASLPTYGLTPQWTAGGFYQEKNIVGYTVVKNSHVYNRIQRKIYGPWVNSTLPPDIPTYNLTDDPYFKIAFMDNNGIAINTGTSPVVESSNPTQLSFNLICNEPDIGTIHIT